MSTAPTRFSQPHGPTLAYYEDTGVRLIEQDGLYFKDLARTGTLLPYEDWRLPAKERAADLASRLPPQEIAGLMLYSPYQMVPPPPGARFAGKRPTPCLTGRSAFCARSISVTAC